MPLTIATGADAADLDALIVYPVETWATYELRDGRQVMVLRDADAGELVSGTPEELLHCGSAPAVTTHPQCASVAAGDDATLSADASGDPAPTVQWQLKTARADWADVPGALQAALVNDSVALADDGSQYRAAFSNLLGTVTTDAANLTVHAVKTGEPANWRDTVPGSTEELFTLDPGLLHAGQNGMTVTVTGTPSIENPWVHVFVDAFLPEYGTIAVSDADFSAGTHHLAVKTPNRPCLATSSSRLRRPLSTQSTLAPRRPGALALTGFVQGRCCRLRCSHCRSGRCSQSPAAAARTGPASAGYAEREYGLAAKTFSRAFAAGLGAPS